MINFLISTGSRMGSKYLTFFVLVPYRNLILLNFKDYVHVYICLLYFYVNALYIYIYTGSGFGSGSGPNSNGK